MEEFYTCQDYQAEAWIMFLKCVRWFCYRLDLFATFFGNLAVLVPVIASRYTCRFNSFIYLLILKFFFFFMNVYPGEPLQFWTGRCETPMELTKSHGDRGANISDQTF